MTDRLRVLVVDDERQVADALGELLADTGCEVHVVHGGDEAPAAVEAFEPHCVLLDLRMPHPDGIETARILRQRWGSQIVLVGITGFGDDVALRADLAVMDHCLRKPIDLATLRRILPLSE